MPKQNARPPICGRRKQSNRFIRKDVRTMLRRCLLFLSCVAGLLQRHCLGVFRLRQHQRRPTATRRPPQPASPPAGSPCCRGRCPLSPPCFTTPFSIRALPYGTMTDITSSFTNAVRHRIDQYERQRPVHRLPNLPALGDHGYGRMDLFERDSHRPLPISRLQRRPTGWRSTTTVTRAAITPAAAPLQRRPTSTAAGRTMH